MVFRRMRGDTSHRGSELRQITDGSCAPLNSYQGELPELVTRSRYASLDGYRAFAIGAVIFAHICYGSRKGSLSFVSDWGVKVFFIMSGFLITTLLIREKVRTGDISMKGFYLRRVLRIVPAAFLFLIGMAALNVVANLGISSQSFLASLFYVQNFPIPQGPDGGWYLGHFWTLSAEEQYYLYVPLLLSFSLVAFGRFGMALIVGGYAAVFVAAHYVDSKSAAEAIARIVGPQVSLMIGSLSAVLVCQRDIEVPSIGTLGSFSLVVGSLLCEGRLMPVLPSVLGGALASICICTLIVCGIRPARSLFFKVMNLPALAWVGRLSYTLYLWQQLFTWKTLSIHRARWIDVVLNLSLLLAISCISYYFVESYFLRIKDRLART